MIMAILISGAVFFLLGHSFGSYQERKIWMKRCKDELEKGVSLRKETENFFEEMKKYMGKQNLPKKEKDECGCCDRE